MSNINKNSWYFNKSSDLGGNRLDLVYKRTRQPLEEGFVNGIELPGDILITEANKSIIVNEILEVLSEPNNKNTLSVFTSCLDSSVDFPAFLIDLLKDIAFLQNLEISGFFNPFDLSDLTMFNGEKGFSGISNRVYIDLLCPYGFDGGEFKAPINIDQINVTSSDSCSYSGRRVRLAASTQGFRSPIIVEADQFNSGRFRNLKTVSSNGNFDSVYCYEVDSVLLGAAPDSRMITMDFNSLSLNDNEPGSCPQERIDLNLVNELVLGKGVRPRVLNINHAYLPIVNNVKLNASEEYYSRFPFLTNTSEEVQ